MKIVPFDDSQWTRDHPSGLILFQHLLQGDPAQPDNFMLVLARQDGDFLMPRHRHNFDQLRLPLSGDMNLGRGLVLKEGQVGYFAEGLAYGPQQDLGQRLLLVLQFAGASNEGFMSIGERRQAMADLVRAGGRFVGPHYHHPDGRVEWSLNTVWRHVYGRPLRYPRPRYPHLVVAEPRAFHWLPLPGAPGVAQKYLGAFSERAVWVEMLQLTSGAHWVSTHPTARRLVVVLSGAGEVQGQPFATYTALQVEAGQTLALHAGLPTELYLIGLPPVVAPPPSGDDRDDEDLPAEEADLPQL